MRTQAQHHDPSGAEQALKEMESTLRLDHQREQAQRAYLYAAGRLLLAVVFLAGAWMKVRHYPDVVRALGEDGLSDGRLLVAAGIGIELVGGLMIALGLGARQSAKALIAYLMAVSIIVLNDGWSGWNQMMVIGNLAFIGGLLMIAAHGPGPVSLERALHRAQLRRAESLASHPA
jgi:putative oxidoreductase